MYKLDQLPEDLIIKIYNTLPRSKKVIFKYMSSQIKKYLKNNDPFSDMYDTISSYELKIILQHKYGTCNIFYNINNLINNKLQIYDKVYKNDVFETYKNDVSEIFNKFKSLKIKINLLNFSFMFHEMKFIKININNKQKKIKHQYDLVRNIINNGKISMFYTIHKNIKIGCMSVIFCLGCCKNNSGNIIYFSINNTSILKLNTLNFNRNMFIINIFTCYSLYYKHSIKHVKKTLMCPYDNLSTEEKEKYNQKILKFFDLEFFD